MNKEIIAPSGPSDNEEQEMYLGDFLVRTEFFTKECYDRLILRGSIAVQFELYRY